MPTVQQTDEFQEILNILDPDIGHFADKLAKWTFKRPEFLRGLVFMLKEDIGQYLDFDNMKVVSPYNISRHFARNSVRFGVHRAIPCHIETHLKEMS